MASSYREDECINLENTANPEEADELEEMTADEMAIDGYYVVAGIARHQYKQGWKFLTLWRGYGLSDGTWEPISAFTQRDRSINPIFRSYPVENHEGQLLTCARPYPSIRRKSNLRVPIYLLFQTELRRLQGSGGSGHRTQNTPSIHTGEQLQGAEDTAPRSAPRAAQGHVTTKRIPRVGRPGAT